MGVVAAAPPRGRTVGRVLARTLGAMLVLLGLVMLGLAGLIGYGPYHIVTTWPSAEAVVVASDVFSTTTHTRGSRARGIVYGAVFAFRYSVDGRPYVSRTEIGYRTSSRSEMVEWTRKLPVGMHHAIRYHPLDPTRISLAVGSIRCRSPRCLFWFGGD